MNNSVIEVKDFRKTYGDFVAVDGISFDVMQSETFGLLGPNVGTVRVAGVNPAREPRSLRNVIGVQLQSSGLPESITPDEAMKFFCAYHIHLDTSTTLTSTLLQHIKTYLSPNHSTTTLNANPKLPI